MLFDERWRGSAPPERRNNHGGLTVEALVDAAASGTGLGASASAALESAAGLVARCFAQAEILPRTPTTRAVTATVLSEIGRDLIRRGESVHELVVGEAGLTLQPAGSWDVRGGVDRSRWWYRTTAYGPQSSRSSWLPGAAVLHCRYAYAPALPWRGLSPLEWAAETGRLHANIERALGDEAGTVTGFVLPMPTGAEAEADAEGYLIDAEGARITDSQGREVQDPNAALRGDLQRLRGRLVTAETTRSGHGEGAQAAPARDWEPVRLGARPPEHLVALHGTSATAVLAACGIPPALIAPNGQAAATRESLRQFQHTTLGPLGEIVADELRLKLEVPELRFRWDRLGAADVTGRARAFNSLVQGGMDAARAAELAGLG